MCVNNKYQLCITTTVLSEWVGGYTMIVTLFNLISQIL